MKQHLFVTAPILLSVAFLVFMVLAAPRGGTLASKTPPSAHQIADRFSHFHYSGRAVCDVAKMIGMCGDVGSLTSH